MQSIDFDSLSDEELIILSEKVNTARENRKSNKRITKVNGVGFVKAVLKKDIYYIDIDELSGGYLTADEIDKMSKSILRTKE